MAKVSGNGRYVKAASRMPANGERKPVGRAPKDFNKYERDAWNIIVDDIFWCNKSHRLWVGRAARKAARLKHLDNFFTLREAECVKNGQHISDAILDDDGKKEHVKHKIMMHIDEELRKMLSSLGATPAAQVRIMSGFTKMQTLAGGDVEGSPADRGRYFT